MKPDVDQPAIKYPYSNDQIAEIYAKLENAKLLTKMGSDLAKQAEIDIKFYRMINKADEK